MREEEECKVTTREAEMVILRADRVTRRADEYKIEKSEARGSRAEREACGDPEAENKKGEKSLKSNKYL